MREAEKAPMKRHAGLAKWEWEEADAFVEANQLASADAQGVGDVVGWVGGGGCG